MLEVHSDRELLERLQAILRKNTASCPESDYTLRGLWQLSLRYRPSPDERLFRYNVLMSQSYGDGICYSDTSINIPDSFIGMDVRIIKDCSHELFVSVLDSAFASIPIQPTKKIDLFGRHADKAIQRAQVVVDVVDDILRTVRDDKFTVLNIGAIGHIIKELQNRSYRVLATDLDQHLVGQFLHGVEILSGTKNSSCICDCDIVIVSGMALATRSLVEIASSCNKCGIPCIVVAETGSHIAPHYAPILQLAAVVAEPFPFYTFMGPTSILVYMSPFRKGVVS